MMRRFLILIVAVLCCQAHSTCQSADTIDVRLPRTVSDAHERLVKLLPDSVLRRMRSGTEEDMVQYHFGLGMWMRNNWGLWTRNSGLYKFFDSAGVHQPDDMSGIILSTFWCRLNNHDQEIQRRIDESVHQETRMITNLSIVDSACPLDRSRIKFRTGMEISGPPYKYIALGYCARNKHPWVYELDRPLCRPTDSLVNVIRANSYFTRQGMLRKQAKGNSHR
jgi:hypothetical protein